MTQIFNSDELFYEPPKRYPESFFEIDGINVHFKYIMDTMPHFDLCGDISETGYRSCFPVLEYLNRHGVEETAREAIKQIRADYQKEQEKLKRKRKSKERL